MRAHYKSRDGRLVVEIEAQTQKALFKAVAEIQGVFEVDTQCGCCESGEVGLNVRTVDANEYYSLHCRSCGAELNFGQHKQGGTLFAKTSGPNRGWKRWEAARLDAERIEAEAQPQASKRWAAEAQRAADKW